MTAAVALAALACGAGCATGPRLPALAPDVHGELHLPSVVRAAPHPAVVILHGFGGSRDIYAHEAEILADAGFAALVLDYYGELRPGPWCADERTRRWRAWQDAVVAATSYLRSHPAIDADRIALLGFSQGGALALATAPRIPDLRALVDYFGPDPNGWFVRWYNGHDPSSESAGLAALPATLILHGTWDPIVSAGQSRDVAHRLENLGVDVELRMYPRTLHAFNDADAGLSNNAATADDARAHVLAFLREHLGP